MEVDYVTNWPQDGVELGQVGGVATDTVGNVYVFHRADRIWDGSSFNSHDEFLLQSIPIEAETIVVYNADGKVIRKWGANMFYMPHGITVDDAGNVWVTDVALHQVFRFPADGTAPDLVVGEKFKPGKDAKHFCKPSDIAILKSGEFYVSDGYCNHRIIKFSPKGVFLMQWGTGDINIGEDNYPAPGNFNLPHGITIAEEKNLVCVADRLNGRIQCFDLKGGFKRQMHPKEFGPYVYAVDYCPDHGGMLFAINGPSPYSPKIELQGFILNISNGDLIGSFKAPTPFERPHDIAVDAGTHSVYVGDLSGKQKIWKFNVREKVSPATGSHVSVKKGDIPMDIDAPHDDDTVNQPVTKDKDVDKTASDLNASLIVGALLIIPVVLLIAITITVRLYRAGKLTCYQQRRQQKFSLGNFLNSHKGFDPLSTEESDHEVDPLNDSDNEEFSITRKA